VKAKTNKKPKTIQLSIKRLRHHIKMTFVPHHKNNYRPHLIRSYGLVIVAVLVIGLQLAYNGLTTGSVLGREADITINGLLDQTNRERYLADQVDLRLNDKLNRAAYLKAQDMFAKQYWSHTSPDGTEPWKWFGDVDYNYNEAGENLAKGFMSTNAVMTAWLNSPEHKANILKADYQDVGFGIMTGVLDGHTTTIVVALYGLSAESVIANTQASFVGSVAKGQMNILTQFAVAFQSVTPAAIIGLFLTIITVLVAIWAHTHRQKLPKALRQSWYKHHGLYKAVGLMSYGIIIILLYGGGQI